MKSRINVLCAGLAIATLTPACTSLKGDAQPGTTVQLEARSGSKVKGTLTLREQQDGVLISGDISGLMPNKAHGFHVHEKGDCSAPDGMSAGPHFNPAGAPHGKAWSGPHHAGDMPNLETDNWGVAHVSIVVAGATLSPGPSSIAGRAIVVHRDPDDYATQPAGNAGPRIACGVIPGTAAPN
jgi:Cu-Zn family superoxide dismutase